MRVRVSIQGSEFLITLALGAGVYLAVVVAKMSLAELVVLGIVFFQVISIINKLQKFFSRRPSNEGAYIRTEQLIAQAEAQTETHTGTRHPRSRKSAGSKTFHFRTARRPS